MAAAGPPEPVDQRVAEFVARWKASEAAERANYQLFLTELCEVLGVPKPDPTQADVSKNAYVFERDVKFQNPDGTESHGRIDLYKRGSFVLEAKQGSIAPDRRARPARRKAQVPHEGHGRPRYQGDGSTGETVTG